MKLIAPRAGAWACREFWMQGSARFRHRSTHSSRGGGRWVHGGRDPADAAVTAPSGGGALPSDSRSVRFAQPGRATGGGASSGNSAPGSPASAHVSGLCQSQRLCLPDKLQAMEVGLGIEAIASRAAPRRCQKPPAFVETEAPDTEARSPGDRSYREQAAVRGVSACRGARSHRCRSLPS